MTKYATFGQDGILNGRYDTDINTVIPNGAVEISDTQFFYSIQHSDGYLELVNGVVQWTVPPPPQLPQLTDDELKAGQIDKINASYTTAVSTLTDGYPVDEIQSWIKQEREARAWLVDNNTATPLLTAMSTARNITLSDLVTKVINKADAFTATYGDYTGKRQKLRDQVDALPPNFPIEDLNAIVW